jgi:NDP-sugar pyrophosphorylase family protein
MLPVIILAGGLGTRLGALSRHTPKALMPLADKPFIYHQLRLLALKGVKRVIICAGYLGELIENVVGQGQQFGLKVNYSFDWPDLLGTGGALRKAAQLIEDESFMVIYGDSYLEIDYQAVAKRFLDSQKPALMTVYRNQGLYDRGNVFFANGVIRLYDKKLGDPTMDYIDYGLSCLKRDIITDGPVGEVFDLADLLNALSLKGELAGFEVNKRFYEIGSPQSLSELDDYLRAKIASTNQA